MIYTNRIFKDGSFITLQEKFRENSALKFLDFTQEYKNAAGTDNENDGEYFHLAAQLYFYGWADANNESFEKWAILDVLKYKLMIQDCGGIEKMGTLRTNEKHGMANFYCIPIRKLTKSFVTDYRKFM